MRDLCIFSLLLYIIHNHWYHHILEMVITFHVQHYCMGLMTIVTKYSQRVMRVTIPARITKQSKLSPGDMLIWSYVPGRDVYEVEIRRMLHDKKEE